MALEKYCLHVFPSLLDKVCFNSHLSSPLKVCISDRGTARGCFQFQDSLFKSLPEECRNWKRDVRPQVACVPDVEIRWSYFG